MYIKMLPYWVWLFILCLGICHIDKSTVNFFCSYQNISNILTRVITFYVTEHIVSTYVYYFLWYIDINIIILLYDCNLLWIKSKQTIHIAMTIEYVQSLPVPEVYVFSYPVAGFGCVFFLNFSRAFYYVLVFPIFDVHLAVIKLAQNLTSIWTKQYLQISRNQKCSTMLWQ